MNSTTPIIFADGTSFYEELANTYIRHGRGLFILAPSGVGKTYFVNKQADMDWMDGDDLWPAANADLTTDEWNNDRTIIEAVNIRSDIITQQATDLGFWIIGSSNSFLKPDAIVLPDWDIHVSYIQKRESANYDGGAKTEDLEAVKRHRDVIAQWGEKGVPCFKSVKEAAMSLSDSLKQ